MSKRKPRFLSLFSGCGGFDLGLRNAGFSCIASFDINPNCIDVLKSNLKTKAHACDLTEPFDFSVAAPDLVVAGPPCQGFSTVGKREFGDPRNSLLVHAAKLAAATNPKCILIENVFGAIAGKHRKYWDRAVSLLKSNGYRVAQLEINALDFGLPQTRRRVMLLAWSSSFDCEFAIESSSYSELRSVLSNLDDTANHDKKFLPSASRQEKIARRIAPNQKLSNVRASARSVHTWDIPEVFGRTNKLERLVLHGLQKRRRQKRKRNYGDADPVTCRELYHFLRIPVGDHLRKLIRKGYVRQLDGAYDLAHTFNGKYRRLDWDNPAPTVDSKFGIPTYFLHPAENRGFTVREAARIQGFPDDFIFSGAREAQYRMIGNAVPPVVAENIGRFIREALLG